MVIRNEPDPPEIDQSDFRYLGEYIVNRLEQQQWQFTPPLIVGLEEDADKEEFIEWVNEELHHHPTSEPDTCGYTFVGGLVISQEDIPFLCDHDDVIHVEVEGYAKTCSG